MIAHCETVHKSSGSPNALKVSMGHGGKPWMCDPNHPHFVAGRKATKLGRSGDWNHYIFI